MVKQNFITPENLTKLANNNKKALPCSIVAKNNSVGSAFENWLYTRRVISILVTD